MPLALLAFGTILFVAAIRNTQNDLFTLLKGDLTGDAQSQGGFFVWVLALGIVGAAGYVRPIRPVANAFLVLILIMFILSANRGGHDFLSSFISQIMNRNVTLGGAPSATPTTGPNPAFDANLGGALSTETLFTVH